MRLVFKYLVLSTITILFVLASAPASLGQKLEVNVLVFSDVPISGDLLARAEKRAQAIFSYAGLTITWFDCTHPDDRDNDPICFNNLHDLMLKLTSHSSKARIDAGGVAFLGPGGTGRYADVFWNRVKEIGENSSVSLDHILGSVMAHEMGHLLLGMSSHSINGLMCAHWGSAELHHIEREDFYFLPQEAKRMRSRISNAGAALASRGDPSRSGR